MSDTHPHGAEGAETLAPEPVEDPTAAQPKAT